MAAARVCRPAPGPVGLHRLLHCGNCARRHFGRQRRTNGGGAGAGAAARNRHAPGRRPAGAAGDCAAADKPVFKPDKKLVAGRGHRLSRNCFGLRGNRAFADRAGNRGFVFGDDVLPVGQPADCGGDEFLQPPLRPARGRRGLKKCRRVLFACQTARRRRGRSAPRCGRCFPRRSTPRFRWRCCG